MIEYGSAACWVLLLLLAGCDVGGACLDNHYQNVTTYPVHAQTHTPEGIAVDGDLDFAELDARTDRVEACLRSKFPDGRLPPDVVAKAQCLSSTFVPVVPRSCITVKVAPDWHMSCVVNQAFDAPQEQVFSCTIDPTVCMAKGITPTDACPCECRGAIQDQDTIVTTPNMHLYANDLIRLVTGCNVIWATNLGECYEP